MSQLLQFLSFIWCDIEDEDMDGMDEMAKSLERKLQRGSFQNSQQLQQLQQQLEDDQEREQLEKWELQEAKVCTGQRDERRDSFLDTYLFSTLFIICRILRKLMHLKVRC
jgi:hypothetical protein